ncbi:unnamed protein product, partial [Ilex paraguariensis]
AHPPSIKTLQLSQQQFLSTPMEVSGLVAGMKEGAAHVISTSSLNSENAPSQNNKGKTVVLHSLRKLTDSFRGVAGSFPVDKTGAFLPSAQNEGKADGRKWPTQKPKWRQIVQPGNQANPSSKEHEISRSHVKLKYCKPAKDGDEIFVSPPNEVAQKGYSNWEHCLVSYFVEKKLPYSVVNAIVHKICGQMGLMEVLANDKGFYFFRSSNEE